MRHANSNKSKVQNVYYHETHLLVQKQAFPIMNLIAQGIPTSIPVVNSSPVIHGVCPISELN